MPGTLTDLFCGAAGSGPGAHYVPVAALGVLCAAAVVSSVVPVVEHLLGAVFVAAALMWFAVAVLRGERRIRARLADPPTRPTPRGDTAGPVLRAGPGAHAPAPPVPTDQMTAPIGGV